MLFKKHRQAIWCQFNKKNCLGRCLRNSTNSLRQRLSDLVLDEGDLLLYYQSQKVISSLDMRAKTLLLRTTVTRARSSSLTRYKTMYKKK